MKITKRQLKRIIKEEKRSLLSEQPGRRPFGAPRRTPESDLWVDAINDLIYSEWAAAGVTPDHPDDASEVETVLQALRNVIADLEQLK
jgi:hypothetical protein